MLAGRLAGVATHIHIYVYVCVYIYSGRLDSIPTKQGAVLAVQRAGEGLAAVGQGPGRLRHGRGRGRAGHGVLRARPGARRHHPRRHAHAVLNPPYVQWLHYTADCSAATDKTCGMAALHCRLLSRSTPAAQDVLLTACQEGRAPAWPHLTTNFGHPCFNSSPHGAQ